MLPIKAVVLVFSPRTMGRSIEVGTSLKKSLAFFIRESSRKVVVLVASIVSTGFLLVAFF